jgi:hypothetical protein
VQNQQLGGCVYSGHARPLVHKVQYIEGIILVQARSSIVEERGGQGSRSCDGAATAWGGLPLGACGESSGREKQEAGRTRLELNDPLGVSMSMIV